MMLFRNFFQGCDGDIRECGCNNGNYRHYCTPVYDPRAKILTLVFTDTCELHEDEDNFERDICNCGLRKVKKILRELEREERKEFDYQVEYYGVDAPEIYV